MKFRLKELSRIIISVFICMVVLASIGSLCFSDEFSLNQQITWERKASIAALSRYQKSVKANWDLIRKHLVKRPGANKNEILMLFENQRSRILLFRTKLSEKIYREYPPDLENINFSALQVTAAQNEWESLQFGVLSQDTLKNVHFEISDLISQDGKTTILSNGSNVRKYCIFNVLTKKTKSREVTADMDIGPELRNSGFVFEEEPVVLMDLPGIDIPRFNSQAFLIDFFIDKATKPGVYSGQIKLFQDKTVLISKPIQLTVLPFELDLAIDWSRGAYISKFLDEKEVANLIEHGHTQVSWWTDADCSLKLDNNKITADFSGYVGYLNMLDRLKMPGPHLIFLGGDSPKFVNKVFKLLDRKTITNGRDTKFRRQYLQTDLSPPFEAYFGRTLKQFYDQMKGCGHENIPVAILDEPDHKPRPERLNWYNRIFAMIEKNVPELTTFGVFYHKKDEEKLSHRHDIWSTNSPSIDKHTACRSSGKKLYTYHGGFMFYKSAAMPRFPIGIIPWVYDASGSFYWAIWNHSDNKRQLDDIFSLFVFEGRATTIARAPFKANYGPLSTIVHKGFREAVDDRRYIATLEKMIENARGTLAKKEADRHRKWLNHIKLTLRKRLYIRGGHVQNHKQWKDWHAPVSKLKFKNTIGGFLTLRNLEDFSISLRQDVIRRIISLQSHGSEKNEVAD